MNAKSYVFKFHSALSLYLPVTTTLLVAVLADSGELTMEWQL